MICDKGNFTFNIAYETTIRELQERIEQLCEFIENKGLVVPKEIKRPRLRGGYNTDDEE